MCGEVMGEVMGAIIARRLYLPVTKGVAGPTGSPVGAEEVVASGATAAPHVSRPGQASLGPRRFACIRGLRHAHHGPRGNCRHNGNQGTTGRPARAHDTLQKISLRTRLFKPGEPRQGFSPRRGTSPREGIPDAALDPAKDQAKTLGEASGLAGFLPHEASSVSAKERTWALRPPQSHGRGNAR